VVVLHKIKFWKSIKNIRFLDEVFEMPMTNHFSSTLQPYNWCRHQLLQLLIFPKVVFSNFGNKHYKFLIALHLDNYGYGKPTKQISYGWCKKHRYQLLSTPPPSHLNCCRLGLHCMLSTYFSWHMFYFVVNDFSFWNHDLTIMLIGLMLLVKKRTCLRH
jgi:hypothetical protein